MFTESATPDLVAAVRYVWSPPGARRWSSPVTLATPAGGAVLPHVQAGDAGRVAFTWYASDTVSAAAPWRLMAAVTPDARLLQPNLFVQQVSSTVLLQGTAANLVGQCTSGSPASGLLNGLTCHRAPDNYGTAVDADGRLVVTYSAFEVPQQGTYVAVLRTGPRLVGD